MSSRMIILAEVIGLGRDAGLVVIVSGNPADSEDIVVTEMLFWISTQMT